MLHKKHKDILARVITGIITGAYIGYICRLIMSGNTDVTIYDTTIDYALIAICLIVAIFLLIQTLYKPIIQKRIRLTIALIGLILIVLAHYTMLDNPEISRYLADFTKIFGLFVLIGGASGAIIPQDVIQDIQESNIEIIEA